MSEHNPVRDAHRVSGRYRGGLGDAYFRYQQQDAKVKGMLRHRKLARYVRAGDAVVDFGCGDGSLLVTLDARERIGVDVNPRNLERAAERGLRVCPSTDDLPSASVDLVMTHHALEHTLSPLDELRGLRRVLRPGGRAVLVVPIDDWRVQREADRADVNHHLYTWTPLLFAHLLGEAGFAVDQCRVVHHALPGRLTAPLARALPARAFDVMARLVAFAVKRREIVALAHRPLDR